MSPDALSWLATNALSRPMQLQSGGCAKIAWAAYVAVKSASSAKAINWN
jgi:hypothetical protein